MIPSVDSKFNTTVENPRGFVGYVGCAWSCPYPALGKEAQALKAMCHGAGAREHSIAPRDMTLGEDQGYEGSHRHLHVPPARALKCT